MSARVVNSSKAINFDLDTNAIKGLIASGTVGFKEYTVAYSRIRRYLERSGFDHDQGSGYVSKRSMSVQFARFIIAKLGQQQPWLAQCMPKCRLTSFDGKGMVITDLTADLKAGANSSMSGSELARSSVAYTATKDSSAKTKAEDLRKALTTTSIKPSISALAQSAAAAPKPAPAAKTKALIKSKSYGK